MVVVVVQVRIDDFYFTQRMHTLNIGILFSRLPFTFNSFPTSSNGASFFPSPEIGHGTTGGQISNVSWLVVR